MQLSWRDGSCVLPGYQVNIPVVWVQSGAPLRGLDVTMGHGKIAAWPDTQLIEAWPSVDA